jgi:hypothetical protein
MIKNFYEMNISVDFSVGKHPILGAISFLIMHRKKMIAVIKEAIERDFKRFLSEQDFEEIKPKIIH